MATPLAYLLHSGQLFGTERMALATLQQLRGRFDGVIIAPPGPLHAAARAAGVPSVAAAGRSAMLLALAAQLWRHPHSALLTTGVWQSMAGCVLRWLRGGHGAHLHVVHGGTDERLSYGRKRWLSPLRLRFVAVSAFVRERLLAHGVRPDRIEVVHNFLPAPPEWVRPPFRADGVRRVVMLTRLDRIKRVGLLFDALDRLPALAALQFDVYGSGEDWATLRERAAGHANVTLHGFVPDAAAALARADLLLHTCPEEPFGLVLLEAFAAGVPVLVPNSGGTAEVVRDGLSGWHFSANDPMALGRRLLALAEMPAEQLNAMATRARQVMRHAFDPVRQATRYADLAGGRP